ncbi:MAG: NYN domain-containing protein [bacterium]|nr:NYN domain-containing protein [bacterium]
MNEYHIKLKDVLRGRISVFIDAANLEQSVRSMWVNPKDIPDNLKHFEPGKLKWTVDYRQLKMFFEKMGELTAISYYSADFESESHRNFMYMLKKAGYKLSTKQMKKYFDHAPEHPHRKANFDVEIAVDAIDKIEKYDTFILFSGDCDFEYLLKVLRGKGKMTIVFSRSGHVAKELPPACHHYFDITDFRSEILSVKIRPRP